MRKLVDRLWTEYERAATNVSRAIEEVEELRDAARSVSDLKAEYLCAQWLWVVTTSWGLPDAAVRYVDKEALREALGLQDGITCEIIQAESAQEDVDMAVACAASGRFDWALAAVERAISANPANEKLTALRQRITEAKRGSDRH